MLKRLLASVALLASSAQAQTLAPTPPMGWNSWDSYALTITEQQFAENVDVFAAKLKPFGWRYAVIDEGWYLQNPEAANQTANQTTPLRYTVNAAGQFDPAPNRFPSAAAGSGLKAIGDRVHAKGLQFGLHIIRGIPKQTVAANTAIGTAFHAADAADQTDTCPWNPDNFGVKSNPAGQAWYDALIRQYASWGIDYLKVDCIASHPYKADEIAMIHRAILHSGRPIVLSLSPGPTALENGPEVSQNAQLWRISDDVWDYWQRSGPEHFPQSVKAQFPVIASWASQVHPGAWPDADMLPLGELRPMPGYGTPRASRLSPAEQRTMFTLWAITRSPLFFGGNLTLLDPATTALLTNPAVIALNQQGHNQRLLTPTAQPAELTAWMTEGPKKQTVLALFNTGDTPLTLNLPFAALGLAKPTYSTRNLWQPAATPTAATLAQTIPPHDCLLLELH